MNIGELFYCSRCMRELENEGICPHCGYDPNQEVSPSILAEGTLLQDGRYQLGAVIGMGGFGITYAAWDYTLSQPVAVKEYFLRDICERDIDESDEVVVSLEQEGLFQIGQLRFSREARVLSTLQSIKNVVAVLDWFEDNNTAYLVMEYVRGITLEEYVQVHKIAPQKLIAMMKELIDALILVHAQGIIHRDISPSNIMVQDNGTVKLIDFGAASTRERRAQGMDMTVIYNRKFAPPEQYDENGAQGAWTDVYALSAVLYYLISKEPPMESAARKGKDLLKPLSAQDVHLKKWQEKAIMDGLILQTDKRIQNMEIFRSVLYHLPMPEEIKKRRAFMIKTGIAMAAFSLFCILSTINLTYGFYLGDGIRYSLRKDGLHLVGYRGTGDELTLPDRRLGFSIVQIDEGVFQGNEELKEIIIPASVKKIEAFAFNDCENLSSVILSEGVEVLDAQAFGNCTNLQIVSAPESLISIDEDTFEGSLDRLVLTGNMDSAAARAAGEYGWNFAHIETEENETGITLLNYETLQENVRIPDLINHKPVTQIGSGVQEKSVFPEQVHSITLPKYLEIIGDFAFYQVQIADIELPKTLTAIGKSAFSQTFLKEIHLPDSVTSVGESAFASCVSLGAASLSSGMKSIPGGCFEGDSALSEVEIPEGIEEIEILAFSRCSKLEKLKLPSGLCIIDNYAFMDCASLETVYLPSSLSFMSISVFSGCPNSLALVGWNDTYAAKFAQKYQFSFYSMDTYEKNIEVSSRGNLMVNEHVKESDYIELPMYFRETAVKRILDAKNLKSKIVILPPLTESIATRSFCLNEYLEQVECPDTLNSIGSDAFFGCKNLTRIDLPEGLKEVGSSSFASCGRLEEIDLPDSLERIGNGAFEHCTGLSQIELPSSLVILDSDVFAGSGLTSVKIPGNIVKCRTAFYGCEQLKEAVIEEGVRVLWGTFAECKNLECAVIPESVYQISKSTFLNCTNLKDVWIYSDDAELNYEWAAVYHIEYRVEEDGTMSNDKIYLEKDKDRYLFSDSPNVTIHGYRGSSAHLYATQYGLNFEEIKDERSQRADESNLTEYTSPVQVFSYERIIKNVTPAEGDDCDHYWPQFQYALGYGLDDLAQACLDAYEAAGEDYDARIVRSTRLFLSQADKLGYSAGAPIVFFENFSEHPSLEAGDIIVAIDETKITSDFDIGKLKAVNASGPWTFTVLRADEGVLKEIKVTVRKEDPLAATRSISPKTFENP